MIGYVTVDVDDLADAVRALIAAEAPPMNVMQHLGPRVMHLASVVDSQLLQAHGPFPPLVPQVEAWMRHAVTGQAVHWLDIECPTCGAIPQESCRNTKRPGQASSVTHAARAYAANDRNESRARAIAEA